MEKLTKGDIWNVQYFWLEKGNVERMSSWEKLRPLFEKEHPEVVKCWDEYKMAKRLLTLVVHALDGGD